VNRLEFLLPAKHQPELKRWAILFFFTLYLTIAKISAAGIRKLVIRVFCPAAIDIVTSARQDFERVPRRTLVGNYKLKRRCCIGGAISGFFPLCTEFPPFLSKSRVCLAQVGIFNYRKNVGHIHRMDLEFEASTREETGVGQ
jgi:hypothetical protein